MGFQMAFAVGLIAGFGLLPEVARAETSPPVYMVLFTHIEDNAPTGTLGSPQSRQNYLLYRDRLIGMANLAQSYDVTWSLQPDWKILRAALLYEDSTVTANTNGKNFLRYLREDLGVVIDPHSHEGAGYNYTDVAHLLDSLGVGGSTVIGGHVWDPTLPEFQEWDRFRVPVAGARFPWAWWRGDILMGSGTPNHVNDPLVSGVWRPRDRYHYFEDDSTGNIAAIGQWRGTLAGVSELRDLYTDSVISTDFMLTASEPISPSKLLNPNGLAAIEDTLIIPLVALRESGVVVLTDFTSLIETWQTTFGARGFVYDPEDPSDVEETGAVEEFEIKRCTPNPVVAETEIHYVLPREMRVRVTVIDVTGREIAVLADRGQAPGPHAAVWNPGEVASGLYFVRIETSDRRGTQPSTRTAKVVLLR